MRAYPLTATIASIPFTSTSASFVKARSSRQKAMLGSIPRIRKVAALSTHMSGYAGCGTRARWQMHSTLKLQEL